MKKRREEAEAAEEAEEAEEEERQRDKEGKKKRQRMPTTNRRQMEHRHSPYILMNRQLLLSHAASGRHMQLHEPTL